MLTTISGGQATYQNEAWLFNFHCLFNFWWGNLWLLGENPITRKSPLKLPNWQELGLESYPSTTWQNRPTFRADFIYKAHSWQPKLCCHSSTLFFNNTPHAGLKKNFKKKGFWGCTKNEWGRAKPSHRALYPEEEEEADKGKGGRTTPRSGRAWTSAEPWGPQKTETNGGWLSGPWCPNDLAVMGMIDWLLKWPMIKCRAKVTLASRGQSSV